MKIKPILASVVVASLACGNAAFAQRDTRDDQHPATPQPRAMQQRHNMPDHSGPGAGPNHNFYKGERLSNEYHNNNYVVDDWRAHGLRQPPRGYHWVQTGADYVLVAVATGIIADLLLGNR